MLQAQRYALSRNWTPFVGHVVTPTEAGALSTCLADDAATLTNAAAISILDAIRGLQADLYSWATVKLYYSVFYSFRAILAHNDVCVLYEGSKPRTLHATAGGRCTKAEGTTHKVVIAQFGRVLATHWLLSQEIAMLPPPEWFMRLREEANYGGRFYEPLCPPHFAAILANGIRRSVSAYVTDRLFAFDEDHAALAYPLHALMEARSRTNPMDDDSADFIKARAKDASGPLYELIGKLTGR